MKIVLHAAILIEKCDREAPLLATQTAMDKIPMSSSKYSVHSSHLLSSSSSFFNVAKVVESWLTDSITIQN